MKAKADAPFVPLNIAVLTVSDTRTLDTDTSGQVFVDRLTAAGHALAERVLLADRRGGGHVQQLLQRLLYRDQRTGLAGLTHGIHRVQPV